MIGLTEQQRRLLDFIETYTAQTGGICPSYVEMQKALSLASKSGVHRVVHALEERGLIRRLPGRARAIEVIHQDDLQAISTETLTAELERRGVICLPPLRAGEATTPPGRTSPEPPADPPAEGGSGLSVFVSSNVHE